MLKGRSTFMCALKYFEASATIAVGAEDGEFKLLENMRRFKERVILLHMCVQMRREVFLLTSPSIWL